MRILPRLPMASRSADPWRMILLSVLAVVLAAAVVSLQADLGLVPAAATGAVAGGLLATAWLLAIRFLMLDTWGLRLWIVVHLASLLFVLLLGKGGMIVAITFAGFFLAPRRYRPWRLLTARRRAIAFGLGLLTAGALALAARFWGEDTGSWPVDRLRYLGGWSLGGLIMFWLWSLFHLALHMRLHFMRLRPKLAVSAVLIGVIPLLMVIVLGSLIFYTGLGGSRAERARETLESWRLMTAAGTDLSGALFDTTFVWPDTPASTRIPGRITAPAEMADLVRTMKGSLLPGTSRVAVSDSTHWFLLDRSLWLMRWRGLDTPEPRVEAWKLGVTPLKMLSGILRAGIDIGSVDARAGDGAVVISPVDEEDEAAVRGMRVSYRDVPPDSPFWDRFVYFGGTLFSYLKMGEDGIRDGKVFINLRAGWPEMKADFFEGQTNLNIAVAVVLAVLAFFFLVLEIFAVFFGVRISEGIVAAVHALHRGNKALAAGDLQTSITLPNEDEFGDLAASFNEMTAALRKGRDIALANDRLKQEMATARSIQERLLPRSAPLLDGFEVAGASIPSREIGGDYYDFIAQGDDLVGIAIGDVSGKGMPAALLMSNLQASLHGQVLHPGSVSGVVQRINDLMVKSTDSHMFASFFYGLLDTRTGMFICTNAGHNPPLVLRADGRLEELKTGGLLLGMLGDQIYQQATVQLDPGDVIVMYTDGITEAVGPSGDEEDPDSLFGEDALIEVLRRNGHLPASGIKDAVLAAVAEHTVGQPQSDDITLVVIRRQG
ncbi:MAG: SpoIIE family protein phosphatase [bacterium]